MSSVAFLQNIGWPELLCIGVVMLVTLGCIIGAVVVFSVVGAKAKRQPCPHCGESIAKDAKICRFCNREIDAGQ